MLGVASGLRSKIVKNINNIFVFYYYYNYKDVSMHVNTVLCKKEGVFMVKLVQYSVITIGDAHVPN